MHEVFLGIDLGTSSVKALLLDAHGVEVESAQMPYAVSRPHPGWAEQDPEMWWRATAEAVRAVLVRGRFHVLAVGFSGQMHGLVLTDAAGVPLRPAIIWSDGRSAAQAAHWADRLDPSTVEHLTGFPIATGMLGVSLTWVRDREPEVYARAGVAMLPKDYIRFRFTGALATDATDAGGSLLYDIRGRRPAAQILDAVGLRADLLPPVQSSLSVAGSVIPAASRDTGIPVGTPVATGGSDQSMAGVALGLADRSRAAVAISSGGTVFKRTAEPLPASLGLHVMPHAAPDQWLAMGVVLSAGLSIDWLARRMFGGDASPQRITALMTAASTVPPGAEGLLVSSQLGGTRTPVVNDTIRGSIIGLGFHHGQEHITRAMVEGVCVALSRSLESMTSAAEPVRELVISGGGARFAVWRQTLSDVTNLPVRVSSDLEHSALGAAMTASMAIGSPLAFDPTDRVTQTVHPNPQAVSVYQELSSELLSVERAIADRKELAQ